MTAGDRFFGQNEATGEVAGTGALISVPLDFAPQSVKLLNRTTGAELKWEKTMPEGSGMLISGGAAVLNSTSETLSAQGATFFWIDTASGFFTVGETVTGGTSGATGTVGVTNTDNQDDIGLTGIAGVFIVGETITGGTSAVTAVVRSGSYSVYLPTSSVACFYGATKGIGVGLSPVANITNATLNVAYSTLVGTFQLAETITGGTSANTMLVLESLGGHLAGAQINWAGGAGFTLGETITGGTSGATAVVTSCNFDNVIAYRIPNAQWANGRFAVFNPTNITASTITVDYVGSNAITGVVTTAYIAANGITSGNSGFYIGTNASINSPANVIYWEAIR